MSAAGTEAGELTITELEELLKETIPCAIRNCSNEATWMGIPDCCRMPFFRCDACYAITSTYIRNVISIWGMVHHNDDCCNQMMYNMTWTKI